MSTEALFTDCDSFHEVFDEWNATEDSLDAQLHESLSALAAYQSHLDEWQRQLAEERDELRLAREQWERDRALAEVDPINSAPDALAELAVVRDQNVALTNNLLTRTEELCALDQRRAELAAELESAQARERALAGEVEEKKRAWDEERAKLFDEVHDLTTKLENRAKAAASADPANASSQLADAIQPPAAGASKRELAGSSAVLGSIVEQFGKLRLQRANDRQGSKKTR